MAFILNDRVKQLTTTTGTGTLTLGSAITGFETFAQGIGNSNETFYAIAHRTANEFEVGRGTLNGSSTTLARTTVISSSNSDSAVDFSAGEKEVFCTLPASRTPSANMTAQTFVSTHSSTISDSQTMDSGVLAGPVTITGTLTITGNLFIL
jgi:hypothetical protein|tara:strand:- start:21 stop:473 length:453 start_codon:yes stop_codon:yes gene_type:complete